MSKGFITGSGDSLSNAYAIISVEYPQGSALTCSNGRDTLTAVNSYGAWSFGVPSAGTWTVSCTDGTRSASKTVTVSSRGQGEAVRLSYEIIIISPSVMTLQQLKDNIRYVNDASGSVIYEDNGYFDFAATGASTRGWQWKTPIDLTGHTQLIFRGYVSVTGKNTKFGFGSDLTATSSNVSTKTLDVYSQSVTNLTEDTITLPLNSTASLYPGIISTCTSHVYVRSISVL